MKILSLIYLENNRSDSFDVKDIAEDFGFCFLNLAENLVNKIPNHSNIYSFLSVAQYYDNLGLTKKSDMITMKNYLVCFIYNSVFK